MHDPHGTHVYRTDVLLFDDHVNMQLKGEARWKTSYACHQCLECMTMRCVKTSCPVIELCPGVELALEHSACWFLLCTHSSASHQRRNVPAKPEAPFMIPLYTPNAHPDQVIQVRTISRLNIRSNSQTLLKYRSSVSTRQWMNSKIASSFCNTSCQSLRKE